MRKILLLLLFTFSILVSSEIAIIHSLDPNGDGFLSLRKSLKGKEIGRLYNGNKVKILSRSGKYYKVKVISSGRIGYAHSKWIRKIKKSFSKKLHVIRIRSNDTLSVRKNAGTNNKKLGELAYNATGIKKIKCKNSLRGKRWCKVSHPSIITGWVMAKYISSKKSSSYKSPSSSSNTYDYEAQRQREYKRRKEEVQRKKDNFCYSFSEQVKVQACLGNAYSTNENARNIILGNCYSLTGYNKDGMTQVCVTGKRGCYSLKGSETISACVSCDGNNRWLRMYAAGAGSRCY